MNSFLPSHFLYEDVINAGKNEFRNYIYGMTGNNDLEGIKTEKTPKELLDEAGYDLHEFTPQKYEKELNFVLDYFLLDLQNKKVLLYDQIIKDSFVESIGEIKKINIVNQGEEKQIEITPVEGEPIIITVNKLNQMIKLVNNNVRVIGDNFLWRNKA